MRTGNPDCQIKVIWVSRTDGLPYQLIESDPLPQRDALYRLGNRLAQGQGLRPNFQVEYLASAHVVAYHPQDSIVGVELVVAGQARRVEAHRVVSCVGFRPDDSLWRELQVHQCYATAGPMKLAAAIMAASGAAGGDCLRQTKADGEALRNVEPGFFVAGSKSYGRNSAFLLRIGHAQAADILGMLKE